MAPAGLIRASDALVFTYYTPTFSRIASFMGTADLAELRPFRANGLEYSPTNDTARF
jgi:hypothetical protein